nr:MAG TPA_asm: hypothetical protein [Caudoviricetes sp.]
MVAHRQRTSRTPRLTDTKKAARWAASSGNSVCDHPLFIQFCGHMNTVVGVRFGDFVLRALFLCLSSDF